MLVLYKKDYTEKQWFNICKKFNIVEGGYIGLMESWNIKVIKFKYTKLEYY